MKFFRLFMSVSIISVLLGSAHAQQVPDTPPTGGKSAATSQSGGMMTRNMAELNRFADVVLGSWAVRETHEASDMGPAGSSTGTALFRKGPGGLSVIENLRTTGSQGRFDGLGVFWWDAQQQAYKGVWCDSSAPQCDPGATAKWEGDTLVARNEIQLPDGKKMMTKSVYSEITPKSFTFTMYSGPDENTMKPFMTIRYLRKSSPAAATKPNPKQ
jgi:hypothetical protein